MVDLSEYRFEKLSWPEVNEAVAAGKLALMPVATIEDHGLHLPVDTDVVIATAVCERTAELVPDEIVLLPCVKVGYSPHHIDGPGVLTARWDTFINYLKDITTSLAYHGFRKILMVNGHGSNRPNLELAARLTVVERPDVQCAYLSWWDLLTVQETFNRIRESDWVSHACELETSVYLAVDPDHVRMEQARRDVHPNITPHFWSDLVGRRPAGFRNPVSLVEYWSTVSETGTLGDPRSATPAKGEAVLSAAAKELAEVIAELKARPIRPRVPHQLPEAQERNLAKGVFR